MIGRRFAGLALGSFALGLLWFPYAAFRDLSEDQTSLANCQDNGIEAWELILSIYAHEHGGQLPAPEERSVLGAQYRRRDSHFQLTCNTRAAYEWNSRVTRITPDAPEPLAWCGAPHGFRRKWRNVLFSDLRVARVPEEQFAPMRAAVAGSR